MGRSTASSRSRPSRCRSRSTTCSTTRTRRWRCPPADRRAAPADPWFAAARGHIIPAMSQVLTRPSPVLFTPQKQPAKPALKRLEVVSEYQPSGDQPTAIRDLVAGVQAGETDQVLLGVTGSGKTFTMAKVIEAVQKPALILAPNKTLAAQLYGEMKSFFPNNAVEYFVSYYDYYQPEA